MLQIFFYSFYQRLFLLVLLVFCCRCNQTSQPPNFVIIMGDDLGYGDIGCYGNDFIKTPHIDALATGGLKFTDFHANGPVCSPTRAAMLTGRYQQRSGLEGVIYVRGETRETGMEQEEFTFAEALKTAGYATGLFGKWHLGYKEEFNPVHQGFDVFHGYVSGNVDYHSHVDNAGIPDWWHNLAQMEEEGYVTDLITEHAVQFIEDHRDQPFCVYIAHEAPHWPYQGRSDQADRFPGVEFPSLGSRTDQRAAYKEMVEAMDDGVGQVVATLEALGLVENTFVFFCSDNGGVDSLGNNGNLRSHKGTLWEGGHRVPAIAYWPGRIEPGVSHQTVMSMDVFPTLTSLADISLPKNADLDGVDISPLLFNEGGLPDRPLFWRYRHQKVVRESEWKLLVENGEKYLFNLEEDVGETNNLAATEPRRVNALEEKLSDWEQGVSVGTALKTK